MTAACDPFRQIDDLLKALKRIKQSGIWALVGAPGATLHFPTATSLKKALECLVTGTAGRTAADVYPSGYDPYDLEVFKQRTQLIYDSVTLSAKETKGRLGRDLLHSNDAVLSTAGIWLGDPNTFHGLVLARSRRLHEEAVDLAPLLDNVTQLAADLDEAARQVPPGDLPEARALSQETCPELVGIAGEFRKIADGVAATGDLGKASCGATSLQARLEALLAVLPPQSRQAVAKVYEIHRQLIDAVAVADEALVRVQAGATIIPAFDAQIEAASHFPASEEAVHAEIAAQFEELCSEIQALTDAGRTAELAAVVPKIHATAAIALDALEASPAGRVAGVRDHPAALPYRMYVDRLQLLANVSKLTDRMDGIQASITDAVHGVNDRLRGRIAEFQDAIGAVDAFRSDVERAGEDYRKQAQDFVDELCVGILTRLLAMTGYREIEEKFLNGLFGEIPGLLKESATTIGQAVRCLQEFTAGACRTLPDSGPQRFALERLTEVAKAAEQVQEFVGETGAMLQGARESLTGTLDKVAAAIQKEARAAIGAEPATVPEATMPKASPAPRRGRRAGFNCPSDISTDADGFMKTRNPVGLPPGVTSDKDGYLHHDGVEPLPAGTYRDENGFLKTQPPVQARTPNALPVAASAPRSVAVYAPKLVQ